MEIKEMIELVEAVSKADISCFSYEGENARITIEKNSTVQNFMPNMGQFQSVMPLQGEMAAAPAADETSNAAASNDANAIKSPLVGTFYEAAAPGEEPFVKVGDRVSKGQVLGIIEAMKLMNEIESERDGVVKAILVKNEEVVEFDQPLFVIE